MKFDEVELQLLSHPYRLVGVGATEAEIKDAEHVLRVPIRGGYRKFLQRFGWGGLHTDEIYGLGADVPPGLHLTFTTESERTKMHPPLPEHLLPITNNGAGDLVCLDTRAAPDEPPVVMWWHEDGPDQTPEPTATDFLSWLSKMLEERAVSQ